MQVELKESNLTLMREYIAKQQRKTPGYNPSATMLANAIITVYLSPKKRKKK